MVDLNTCLRQRQKDSVKKLDKNFIKIENDFVNVIETAGFAGINEKNGKVDLIAMIEAIGGMDNFVNVGNIDFIEINAISFACIKNFERGVVITSFLAMKI